MDDYEVPQDLTTLLSRHRTLLLELRRRGETVRVHSFFDELELEERLVCNQIIAWQPADRREALQKLTHLAGYVLATGIPLDAATICHSVEPFFSPPGSVS
ncbi:aminoglycoside N3'-acetyltransferase [Rhizobium petrolearium]|uniref:hypothetical protein n=1 Tax=Neorhizobium petrolearium TaxID=515361 RepID=UPI001AE90A42|nr:hypothetical protein [Neorhizobium petrolearium]MBP1844386.1 aminoglycoside N3'-acetyltransferase [Neorhizobium petrolearium]